MEIGYAYYIMCTSRFKKIRKNLSCQSLNHAWRIVVYSMYMSRVLRSVGEGEERRKNGGLIRHCSPWRGSCNLLPCDHVFLPHTRLRNRYRSASEVNSLSRICGGKKNSNINSGGLSFTCCFCKFFSVIPIIILYSNTSTHNLILKDLIY